MPNEFQTLVMRAKAASLNPRTGDVTLTLELLDSTPQIARLLHDLVVSKAEVQVIADREVKL
jgi:hypothetical protein